MQEIRISVRKLVEFLLRSGDIEEGSGSLAEMDAMHQGTRVHKKLQSEAEGDYQAEVPLSYTVMMDEQVPVTVEGRADGIIHSSEMAVNDEGELVLKEKVTIDEIKGTYKKVRNMTEPVPVHLAQAMCYAYFY